MSIHSGGTGNIRHSPRNGFTACSALFPGTSFVDPVIRATRWRRRKLGACIGAPEPHGFAVRNRKALVSRSVASTASRPTFVTIAIRPSWRGGMATANHRITKNGSDFFQGRELDGSISLNGLRKLHSKKFAQRRLVSMRGAPHVCETARRANHIESRQVTTCGEPA